MKTHRSLLVELSDPRPFRGTINCQLSTKGQTTFPPGLFTLQECSLTGLSLHQAH
jgi:hypothetical protein